MTDEKFFAYCEAAIAKIIRDAVLRERDSNAALVRKMLGHTTLASAGEKVAKAIEARSNEV